MNSIQFSQADKDRLIEKLQVYCETELNLELGQFDGEFLLDFISKEFGAYYYNQGLYDAQTVLRDKVEQISEAIEEIEQPVWIFILKYGPWSEYG